MHDVFPALIFLMPDPAIPQLTGSSPHPVQPFPCHLRPVLQILDSKVPASLLIMHRSACRFHAVLPTYEQDPETFYPLHLGQQLSPKPDRKIHCFRQRTMLTLIPTGAEWFDTFARLAMFLSLK